MPLLSTLISLWKWITNLPKQKLATFLFSMVVTILGVQNYYLREDNVRYRGRADYLSDRMDSLRGVYEARIQQCEELRVKEISKVSEDAAEKIKLLEQRFYRDYDVLRKIK